MIYRSKINVWALKNPNKTVGCIVVGQLVLDAFIGVFLCEIIPILMGWR